MATLAQRRGDGWASQGTRPARPGAPVDALLVSLCILLALALRILRLDFQPLWWDEGYSVWFATHPLAQMAALTAQDIHPPLYYALLHGWIGLLGAGPVALRLFSVLLGIVTIPVIYRTGLRLLSRRAALLAAFLLAISPLHVYYSQEVRMYGLVALLSTGVLATAWRVLCGASSRRGRAQLEQAAAAQNLLNPALVDEKPPLEVASPQPARHFDVGHPGWLHWLLYILLATAALYTQYYALFLPIGLTIYAGWRWWKDRAALARWLVAQAIVALLYLPWAIYAAPRLVLYVSQKVIQDADRPLDLAPYLARHLSAFLAGHLEGPLAPWWPLALLLLGPLAAGLWLVNRRTETSETRGEGAPGPANTPSRPVTDAQ